jgi:diguanylate cyclase (GGDEF)-like protein
VNALHWFDNRTILSLESLIAATFGIAIFAIHRTYPRIRGARHIASGFLLGVLATALLAARGLIPNLLSVVVANVFVYTGYLFIYLGLLRYFGIKNRFAFFGAWAAVLLGSCAHLYYATVDNRIIPRIFVVACTIATLRLVMAITIGRNAHGYLHRRIFTTALFLFAIFSLSRIPLTLFHGAPGNYMQQDAVQTYYLLFGVAILCFDGVFFVTLLSFEITRTTTQRAQQDPLTSTYTRRAIEEKLREELARSARTGTTTSVLLLDLDHFKSINDTSGHAAGDAALKHVAATIASILRPFDHLGRFGGDEFLVVLPELSILSAQPLAELVRQTLAVTPSAPTLSIGIAQSDPGESAPSVLARADQALYRAKHAGRDCIRVIHSDATGLTDSQPVAPR